MSTNRSNLCLLRLRPRPDPAFVAGRADVRSILADDGIGLVYGGGSVGLMGEVARAVLDNGGHVTGIIPEFLDNREHAKARAQI